MRDGDVIKLLEHHALDDSGGHDLGRRYDWSNHGGLSTQALCLRVLRAGRYDDILELSRHTGLRRLQQVADATPDLRSNRFLLRKLANIRVGFGEQGR